MLFVASLMLGLAAFVAAEVVTFPQRRREITIKRATAYGISRRETPENELPRFKERVLVPAVEHLAAAALRVNPKTSVDAIGARLIAAGLGSRFTTAQFLAFKTAGAVAGLFVALVGGALFAGAMGLLLAPVLAAVGFKLPDTFLSLRIKSRREQIRMELPDALDLLAVAVEAGLGLDGAIAKLTEHMDGALVQEFAMTLGEMRIGEARADALKKLADRVPAPEVAAFVRSVLQADQLGISLGRILRVQAADSRLRRQAAAEEKAMKAPIKMLFPTALFIFPAMFVVVLGPAMLNINHYLNFGK
jgi:tight adherence protein C